LVPSETLFAGCAVSKSMPQSVILRLVTKGLLINHPANKRILTKLVGLRPLSVENESRRPFLGVVWAAGCVNPQRAPEQLTHTLARRREWLQC
jgi:hypothetical protein